MFWQNLYHFLFQTTDVPPAYGAFHLISLALIISATVIAVWKLKDASEVVFRRFIFIVWCVLAVGEIYREFCFSLTLTDGVFGWDYAWYMFPFQLCSSPLYVLPLIAFWKEGRVRDGFLCFMALWSFFGGAAVMLYPGDVVCMFTGINVQGMVHHGAQLLVGVLITARCGRRMNLRYFLSGLYVFIGYLATAMLLNVIVYHYLRANGMGDTFNMMYISPYFHCTLPVLSDIHAATSWGVVFPLYVLGFILIAIIIFFTERFIVSISMRKENASNI